MFGDFLTKKECESLIVDLANTKFPFVCAHGRPSIIPLIDFHNQRNQKKKPNFKKLVALMKAKEAANH